jgi:hypothetical protein
MFLISLRMFPLIQPAYNSAILADISFLSFFIAWKLIWLPLKSFVPCEILVSEAMSVKSPKQKAWECSICWSSYIVFSSSPLTQGWSTIFNTSRHA